MDVTLSDGNYLSAASFSATSAVHIEPVTWPIQRQKGTPTGTGIRLVIKKLHTLALRHDSNSRQSIILETYQDCNIKSIDKFLTHQYFIFRDLDNSKDTKWKTTGLESILGAQK